jgi:hypothetical protein
MNWTATITLKITLTLESKVVTLLYHYNHSMVPFYVYCKGRNCTFMLQHLGLRDWRSAGAITFRASAQTTKYSRKLQQTLQFPSSG